MPFDRDHRGPLIVGVERSERTGDALALGAAHVRATGARLILVAAYRVDAPPVGVDPGAHARALDDEAQATLRWAAHRLPGVAVESRAVPCTSIAHGLRRVAVTERAAAIVVGPSRRAPLGQVVPGSVGEQLLEDPPCPVAIPPRGRLREPMAGAAA